MREEQVALSQEPSAPVEALGGERVGSHLGSRCWSGGATGGGAMGGAAGGIGLDSPAQAGSRRVTRSVSAATWLDSAARAVDVDVAEVRRSPISPVT